MTDTNRNGQTPEGEPGRKKKEKEKFVTFRRNEIFFDGRSSVMLNLRDVTEQNLSDTARINKLLLSVKATLSHDVFESMKTMESICESLQEASKKDEPMSEAAIQKLENLHNETKSASLQVSCLSDSLSCKNIRP